MRRQTDLQNSTLRLALGLCAIVAMPAAATAKNDSGYTDKTLHAFCLVDHCKGGAFSAGVIQDNTGTLYGIAESYGTHDGGIVYKLVPNQTGSKWTEYILHAFCAKTNCTDGLAPLGELVFDNNYNVLGTTEGGGAHNQGEIYQLTHNANGWSLHVIYSFTGGSDGYQPITGLSYKGQQQNIPWNGTDPLYGTAAFGGAYDRGVVFELTLTGGTWKYEVIHNFKTNYSQYADLETPLLVDPSGNLYGLTESGGTHKSGELYKLAFAQGEWNQTILYNFCAQTNCTDGSIGAGRPFMDASGNLFGAALDGGTGDGGVIFEYKTDGTYQTIYNFCTQTFCQDGEAPNGGLIMDSAGNLFGTTEGAPSKFSAGNVFELSPNGSSWTESSLYTFCQKTNCADGGTPYAPVVLDGSGNLFGTTQTASLGGQVNSGTAFELVASRAAKKR